MPRITRLKAYSHVLDFFGGMFEIRDGKAVVPGGQRAAAGLGRTGRRLSRQGRRVLRQADGQGRRLAGQPLRRARPHPRPGAGLPDRPGAHEALLHRGPRPHHQSRPGAPGLPLQHRHDAAHHAPARGCQRQAAHSRQPGSLAQPLRQPSAGQVRRQADQAGHHAGKSRTTCWKRCSRSPARPWRTSR